MIKLKEEKNCCGCEACVQACALNCISMEMDEEGFWYPMVNQGQCVSCGACERACPILNSEEKPEEISVYAARCREDEIRSTSSSGGVFSMLARRILAEGGVVFGAAFEPDFSVHHTLTNTKADLEAMKGSKYVQSRIGDSYRQTEQMLKDNVPVLFTGTPCQIAGLHAFLGKAYGFLYTVEILCHGVPSSAVWKKYLQEREREVRSKVKTVTFRNKDLGWHQYSVHLWFNNKQTYKQIFHEDIFMKLFLKNICLRPSCYDCKFRESRSGADLTIGDAWGIEKWMPEMDDDQGTSVVIVNTEKGRQLMENIQSEAEIRQANAQSALENNPIYYKSVKPHPKRKQFFAAMRNNASMEELVRMCREPLWRSAISLGKKTVKKLLGRC